MQTSPPFRVLRTALHLLRAVLTAVLLCLLLLLTADLLQYARTFFSDAGRDTLLSVGRWKFIFREELLTVLREKWNLLCRAAHAVLPAPLADPSSKLIELLIRAFTRR